MPQSHEDPGGQKRRRTMKLFAKAALGALALATIGFTADANAATVVVGPTTGVIVDQHNPCLRPPELRPGFCFRHDMWRDRLAMNIDRDQWMREHMWRERERERERQAFLDRRFDRF